MTGAIDEEDVQGPISIVIEQARSGAADGVGELAEVGGEVVLGVDPEQGRGIHEELGSGGRGWRIAGQAGPVSTRAGATTSVRASGAEQQSQEPERARHPSSIAAARRIVGSFLTGKATERAMKHWAWALA